MPASMNESLIDSELRKVMEASGGADDLTWDSFIEAGTHFLSEHRAFVFHIYESSHIARTRPWLFVVLLGFEGGFFYSKWFA